MTRVSVIIERDGVLFKRKTPREEKSKSATYAKHDGRKSTTLVRVRRGTIMQTIVTTQTQNKGVQARHPGAAAIFRFRRFFFFRAFYHDDNRTIIRTNSYRWFHNSQRNVPRWKSISPRWCRGNVYPGALRLFCQNGLFITFFFSIVIWL